MKLWPVEHFFEHICHHFWVGLLLHQQSVQLVRVSSFQSDFLQNPSSLKWPSLWFQRAILNNNATSEWVWLIVHRFVHSAKNLDLAWKLARLANIKCSPTIQCCALTSSATSLVYTATKLRFSGAEMITGYLQLLNMDLDIRAYNWNPYFQSPRILEKWKCISIFQCLWSSSKLELVL